MSITIIDLTNESYGITAEAKEGAIKVTLDNSNMDMVLHLENDTASELAEHLLHANLEKTSLEWEDECLRLKNRVEELENLLEQYEEYKDYVRKREVYVPS